MPKTLFADFPPDEQLSAAVIVPAKNEAQQLESSLEAQADLEVAALHELFRQDRQMRTEDVNRGPIAIFEESQKR